MDKALWIAQIFGPLMTLVGLWMLFYSDNVRKIHASIKATPALVFMRAFINMLMGLFIISLYNVWMTTPSLLVTLLGWALLVRGVGALFFPKLCASCEMTEGKGLKCRGLIPLIWGVLLTLFGFGYWA